jgi:hypothetical protein
VHDYVSGHRCFIDASRFDSAQALARYLLELDADPDAYASYLRWKSEPLRHSFLTMAAGWRQCFCPAGKASSQTGRKRLW